MGDTSDSRRFLPEAPTLVADSPAMRGCMELIEAVANSTTPVMFLGEKGTGKEFLARHLHSLSPRRAQPCLLLPCAELKEGDILLRFLGARGESEPRYGKGILDEAGGGSVILSDLEQMPVGMQKELSAFLSGYDLSGEDGGPRFGVRILTTIRTVVDADNRVFSEGLLNIVGEALVRVPTLRERREDIPRLAALALERANAEARRTVRGFSAGAMDFLRNHDFPGNVNELNRLVLRAVRWARGGEIYREDFGLDESSEKGKERAIATLSELERRHINRVLIHTGWKRRAAARILGLSETTLSRMMRLYGFEQDG